MSSSATSRGCAGTYPRMWKSIRWRSRTTRSATPIPRNKCFLFVAKRTAQTMGQRVMHVNPLHTFVPNTASTMQVKSSRMRTHAECLHEILPRSRDKTLERSTYTRRYSVRLDPMLDSLLDQYFSIPHATYNLQNSDDAEIIARF
jgi:hypothetical protein